jgi:hypothetical protein
MDQRYVVVLGTNHIFQGADNVQPSLQLYDPTYKKSLADLIKYHLVDYIFEEACGLGATTASKLEKPGSLGYCDIDVSEPERYALGMPRGPKLAQALWRETELWVPKIKGASFKSGLVICGYAHLFSISSRLMDLNWSVDMSTHLVPNMDLLPEEAVAILKMIRDAQGSNKPATSRGHL